MKTQATSTLVTLKANVNEVWDGTTGDISKSQVVMELYNGANLTLTSPDGYCNPNSSSKTMALPSGNRTQDALTYAMNPTLVPNPSDASRKDAGTVTCQVNLSEDTWTVVLRFVDSNGYYMGVASDPYVVTVYIPTLDYYTAGGGWFQIPSSSWTGKINMSANNNRGFFGFSVKYANSQKTTPSGKAQFQFRGADGYTYQLKMTSWQGGALTFSKYAVTQSGQSGTQYRATFGGKCILNKIDRATGLVVYTYSNGTCRFDVTDNPFITDTLAVTMIGSDKATLFASGTLQNQVPVTGGGVRVKMPLK